MAESGEFWMLSDANVRITPIDYNKGKLVEANEFLISPPEYVTARIQCQLSPKLDIYTKQIKFTKLLLLSGLKQYIIIL